MQESLTHQIFTHIESRFYTEHKVFIDELSEILHLQKSSVYKKVKGESSLTLEDLAKLCHRYDISLDEICGNGRQRIFFEFPALNGKVKNAIDFLQPIYKDILRLSKFDPILYCANQELPIFYYFSSFPLIAFKFHVFYNLIWKDEKFAFIKYDLQQYVQDKEFKEMSTAISNHFMELNTVEIWSVSMLDNTLNQIRYFYESGLFQSDDDCLNIYVELNKLVDRIMAMLEQGDKSAFLNKQLAAGKSEIFNNEIAHTNNLIYINSKTYKAIYNTYDNPNFMRSTNPDLCHYTENWINKLMKSASPISASNIRDKQKYSQSLRSKVEKARNAILALMENKV